MSQTVLEHTLRKCIPVPAKENDAMLNTDVYSWADCVEKLRFSKIVPKN
jgi:hypothetical protein